MNVELLDSFIKDLEKVNDPGLTRRVIELVELIESVPALSRLPNLKKLKGRRRDFRIRIGDHRVGIRLELGVVVLVRCLPRKSFYRSFP